MSVNTVVAGVYLAANEPLPARGVACIKRRMPILIPGQQVSILLEALGEIVQAEALIDRSVGQICLGNKSGGGMELFLFFAGEGLGFEIAPRRVSYF